VGTDTSLSVARPLVDMAVAQQTQLQYIHNRTEHAKQELRLAKEKVDQKLILVDFFPEKAHFVARLSIRLWKNSQLVRPYSVW
jgi:hypothetical protein